MIRVLNQLSKFELYASLDVFTGIFGYKKSPEIWQKFLSVNRNILEFYTKLEKGDLQRLSYYLESHF